MTTFDSRSSSRAEQGAADVGRLVLRCTVGGLVLMHGLSKLVSGPGPVMGMLRAHDLPGILAWGVYIGEVAAPLLLIAGFWARAAALVLVVNMLVALGLAHGNDIGRLNATGGWAIELQAMYLLGALCVALLGAGPLSVGGNAGRWN